MTSITYTLFGDVHARKKTLVREQPWAEFIEQIRQPRVTYFAKDDCPLISCAEYGDVTSKQGSYRHQGNVQQVFGIEGDYDGEVIPLEDAARLLSDAGVAAVLYTSASNRAELPRWRVLCPLAAACSPDRRAALVGRLNRILGGVLAPESFTLSQSYYIGRVRSADYESAVVDGRCIDEAHEIEPLMPVAAHPTGAAEIDTTTDEELKAAFLEGEGRHEPMLKLAARWAARGMPADEIQTGLHALLDLSTQDGPNMPRLRKQVKELAASAAKKYRDTRSKPAQPPANAAALVRRVEDFERKELRWLVPALFPLGKNVMVAGDPGLAKSVITLDLTAAITAGARAPWVGCMAGEVVLLNAEDDVSDTVRPRLEAAGADLRKVHVIEAVQEVDERGKKRTRHFNLARDIESVRATLRERPGVRLLVIDPISAYMGGVDSHRNTDVREVLAPLGAVAAEFNVTVLSVSHLNKGGSSGANAIYRVTGSLAFVAAARAVFAVVKDEADPERRLFLPVKHNLAPTAKGRAYRVVEAGNGAPRLEWEENPVDLNVDDMLDAGRSAGKQARDREVEDWLKEGLAEWKQFARDMWADAESKGFSKNRVKGAMKKLKVVVEKLSDGWVWSLPGGPDGPLGPVGPERADSGSLTKKPEAHDAQGVRREPNRSSSSRQRYDQTGEM